MDAVGTRVNNNNDNLGGEIITCCCGRTGVQITQLSSGPPDLVATDGALTCRLTAPHCNNCDHEKKGSTEAKRRKWRVKIKFFHREYTLRRPWYRNKVEDSDESPRKSRKVSSDQDGSRVEAPGVSIRTRQRPGLEARGIKGIRYTETPRSIETTHSNKATRKVNEEGSEEVGDGLKFEDGVPDCGRYTRDYSQHRDPIPTRKEKQKSDQSPHYICPCTGQPNKCSCDPCCRCSTRNIPPNQGSPGQTLPSESLDSSIYFRSSEAGPSRGFPIWLRGTGDRFLSVHDSVLESPSRTDTPLTHGSNVPRIILRPDPQNPAISSDVLRMMRQDPWIRSDSRILDARRVRDENEAWSAGEDGGDGGERGNGTYT